MLLSSKAINEASELLEAEDFYAPAHQSIFASIVSLAATEEAVDAVVLGHELTRRKQLRKVGGHAYLLTLVESAPIAHNVTAHARVVLDKAKLRRLAQLANEMLALSRTDAATSAEVDEVIARAEGELTQHKTASRALSFDELIDTWRNDDTIRPAIATPWPELNTLLNGGLERGRLYTIAARPGGGKSVMAMNLAMHAALYDRRAALFSIEMGRKEVAARILAWGSTTPLGDLLARRLDLESSQRMDEFQNQMKGAGFYLVDKESITVEQIVAEAKQLAPLDILAVDYLQLVQPTDRRVPREQQVAHMSRVLKIAARQLDCAVVNLCQLNRGNIKDNGRARKPLISDIRESGAVEQDSDCVLLLSPVEDDPGMVDLCVGKNRQGRTGDLQLEFNGRFAELRAA